MWYICDTGSHFEWENVQQVWCTHCACMHIPSQNRQTGKVTAFHWPITSDYFCLNDLLIETSVSFHPMERCNEIRRPAQAAAMFHSSLSIPFPTTCMPLHTHICTCTHTQGGQPWRPVWEWYIHQWPPHAWFQPRFCPSRVPAEPWTQSCSQPGNERTTSGIGDTSWV